MESMENVVLKLNELLETENLSQESFLVLFEEIRKNESIIIKILDFEQHSEERLAYARKEKIKEVGIQNFGSAAAWRDKEKKIQKYLDLKKELNVRQSLFYFQEDYLLFLYLGTARNDLVIRFWLKEVLEKKQA
jgi:hypothetical protein